jgi:hypothetical protein
MSEYTHSKPFPRKKRRITYQLSEGPTGVVFSGLGCSALSPGTKPPGTTIQFTDKGAQKLTNVHLVLIFWGIQWANNPLSNLITNAVQNLLAGPYMSYLAQYGVRRGSIWGTKFVTNGDPPNPFAYSDIGNFVIGQLDADNLPEPDSDWPIVYAVMLPSNVSFQGDPRVETVPLPPGTVSGVVGANSSIIWKDYDLGDVDNDPAYYFWVGSSGSTAIQANVDYITTVLSHELVEICTDPNSGNGVVQVGGGAATSQIGDVCTSWCDYVRGVKAQSYWVHNLGDPLNGQCVLPKLYSVRYTLAGRNIGGHLGSIQSPIPSLNALITSLL